MREKLLENIIKQRLSEKRFKHSIGVAETAKAYAKILGADAQKAYMAGLVHDIAKEMPFDEMLELCKKGNVTPDSEELKNKALLHAPAGAAILKSLGIEDDDIKNAVRYHTVGRRGMSILEKIIYLADMLEPSRVYPEVDMLRQKVSENFDEAFRDALRFSIIWNMEKGRVVHEGTLHAYNEITEERNEQSI